MGLFTITVATTSFEIQCIFEEVDYAIDGVFVVLQEVKDFAFLVTSNQVRYGRSSYQRIPVILFVQRS